MAATFKRCKVVRKANSKSGFAEATELLEFPLVEPKANEVRVKVIYTGVNLTDINICAGRFFVSGDLPYDLGFEAIGIVDRIGSGVKTSELQVGIPVLVTDPTCFDCFSEYLYKSTDYLVPLPDLRPEYLVSYGSGLTASIGIDVACRVKPGDKVLVVGAAGGTGQIVAQWAKQRGAYVIGTTSSEEKAAYLRSIGVNCVINYKQVDLDQTLTDKFPNGIDVIWDTVGGATLKMLFSHLAKRGRLCVAGSSSSYHESGFAKVQIDDWNVKIFEGSKTLVGFALFDYPEHFAEYLAKLLSMIGDGSIKVQVDLGDRSETGEKMLYSGLKDLVRAEKYLQSGRNLGKVIVKVQEP